MKKIMMTLAAVFCCAMVSTVFTACGDDDESNPNTYRYEVKIDAGSVGYADEIRTVHTAFKQAVGANSSYQEMLSSPQDNEMKTKCNAVWQQYSNIQSTYLKFYLCRITAAVGAADKEDVIATYELGQALTTPYVEYAFVTNEKEAYDALEAKKGTISEEVYNASLKTLNVFLGKHINASRTSAFEFHFKEVLGKFWPDTDANTKAIIHACDSIANAHAADTLAVDVTVSVTKTGLLDKKITKFWEKTFRSNM